MPIHEIDINAPIIRDPMPWISGYLRSRNIEEKQEFLEKTFAPIAIDRRREALWFWFVTIAPGKMGIFSLTKNTFLKIPYEKRNSEYFWDISSMGISWGYADNAVLLTFSMWWIVLPDDTVGIDIFCYVEDDTVKIFQDMPAKASVNTASQLFYAQRQTRVLQDIQDNEGSLGDDIRKPLQ